MALLLSLAGLIFVIVAPIFVYLRAKRYGHNAIRWTLLSLVGGIGLQLGLPIILMIANSVSRQDANAPSVFLEVIIAPFCFILSIAAMIWILKRTGNSGVDSLMSLSR